MARVLTERELSAIRRLAARLEKRGLSAESRELRSIVDASGERREIKASDAAALLQVTPQTVRNWVRRGVLTGRVDQTGHVLVELDALRAAIEIDAAMAYREGSATEVTDEEILAEIDAYRSERKAGQE